MKLKYTNPKAVEPVMVYGGLIVKCGDVIDTSAWGEQEKFLAAKALRTPNWRPVTEPLPMEEQSEIAAPAGSGETPEAPKRRGRKPKAK